jgi:membrane protein required for colicin V production
LYICEIMRNTDIILLIPLLWGVYRGFSKGIIGELTSIVAIFIVVYCSFKFSGLVSSFLIEHFQKQISPGFISTVTFIVIFAGVVIGVYFLSKQLENITKALHIGSLNHILGAIFGLLKWALIVSLAIYSINKVQGKLGMEPIKFDRTSWTYKELQAFAPNAMPGLIEEGKNLAN